MSNKKISVNIVVKQISICFFGVVISVGLIALLWIMFTMVGSPFFNIAYADFIASHIITLVPSFLILILYGLFNRHIKQKFGTTILFNLFVLWLPAISCILMLYFKNAESVAIGQFLKNVLDDRLTEMPKVCGTILGAIVFRFGFFLNDFIAKHLKTKFEVFGNINKFWAFLIVLFLNAIWLVLLSWPFFFLAGAYYVFVPINIVVSAAFLCVFLIYRFLNRQAKAAYGATWILNLAIGFIPLVASIVLMFFRTDISFLYTVPFFFCSLCYLIQSFALFISDSFSENT